MKQRKAKVRKSEADEIAAYFRENADYITGLLVKRLNAVKNGEWTYPLRKFDAETLARLLMAETPTTDLQQELRLAFATYALAAASYAKKIGSASLLAWAEIVDILEHGAECEDGSRYSQPNAIRLIDLEKAAADRLRLDRIVATLPD